MNPLQLRPHFSSKFTLKFQHFFDLVLAMISKDEKSRIDFDKIYTYINEEELFEQIRNKKNEEDKEKENEYKRFEIVAESDAIAIPFEVPLGSK